MKAVITNISNVMQNNTFEVTFNIYNGPNNEELDLQDQVILAGNEEEAQRRIIEVLEMRKAAKQEVLNIPVGFEVTL